MHLEAVSVPFHDLHSLMAGPETVHSFGHSDEVNGCFLSQLRLIAGLESLCIPFDDLLGLMADLETVCSF